jgi:hypothetical protein
MRDELGVQHLACFCFLSFVSRLGNIERNAAGLSLTLHLTTKNRRISLKAIFLLRKIKSELLMAKKRFIYNYIIHPINNGMLLITLLLIVRYVLKN